jgi:hypothetical protein
MTTTNLVPTSAELRDLAPEELADERLVPASTLAGLADDELRDLLQAPNATPVALDQLRRVPHVLRGALVGSAARRVNVADSTRRSTFYAWRLFELFCHQAGIDALGAHPFLVLSYVGWLADTPACFVTYAHEATDEAEAARPQPRRGRRRAARKSVRTFRRPVRIEERCQAPDPERCPEDHSRGRKPGTIDNHIDAIKRVHTDRGLLSPTDDPMVREAMSGHAKIVGIRPDKREPMTLPRLSVIVPHLMRPNPLQTRNRLLLAADAAKIDMGSLRTVDWNGVHFHRRGSIVDAVTISLPGVGRSPTRREHTYARRDDELCLVAALLEWRTWLEQSRADALTSDDDDRRRRWHEAVPVDARGQLCGPLLQPLRSDGSIRPGRTPRVTLVNALGSLARGVGVEVGKNVVPNWTAAQRRRAGSAAASPTLRQLRDRALLLMGVALCLRGDNLSQLVIGDVTEADDHDGFDVLIRRSKTDQLGQGRTLVLAAPGGALCPATAYRQYLAALQVAVRETFGHRLPLDWPVFLGITRSDRTPEAPTAVEAIDLATGRPRSTSDGTPVVSHYVGLSPAAIGAVITARATSAGMGGFRWGAHSLRRGAMTEGARQKMGLRELMDWAGHTSASAAQGYIDTSGPYQETASYIFAQAMAAQAREGLDERPPSCRSGRD